MDNLVDLTLKENANPTWEGIGACLVRPTIRTNTHFELKEQILNILNETPFFSKELEKTHNHIE